MKKILIFLFTFVISPIFSQTETCLGNQNHPGYRTIVQNNSSGSITREYILHVPSNYDNASPTPLVINMHGFGDCADNYIETVGNLYEFNALANQENILVAYPQGAYRPEKEDTYWEPGDNGTDDIYENDTYFIEQLISDINNDFNVDSDKIFACGYSNGGMMAYSLACNRSNLFSAIGIMSGTMLDEDCTLDNPIPIITFHGIADEVLPYNGNLWYQSISEVVNFWLDLNNIPATSQVSTELNGGNVVKDEYSGGTNNTCLALYTIYEEWDKPGDHVWFSEAIDGSSPNQIMWDFFVENCSTISPTQEPLISDLAIKVQPNPFTNHITIDYKHTESQKFIIYDVLGNSLLSGNINANTNTIEANSLPPNNIYILKIGSQTWRLLKTE